MTAFPVLLQLLHLMTVLPVPAGSQLRVRMNTPVASWSSTVGMPIRAVLIAPVMVNRQIALPAGCTLNGRVRSVTRVGLGIRHERASLALEFTSLALPGGDARAIVTRVAEVDNSRERVGMNGLVQGVRATNSIAYRVSGYVKMALLWNFHAELAGWAIKSLVVQLPEPEIYYPAGTELTLSVNEPWLVQLPIPVSSPSHSGTPSDELEQADISAVGELAASLPFRTTDEGSGLPSDLTNIMFAGTRAQILTAFREAGWSVAEGLTWRARIRVIRAAAELRGNASPMASLLLNGEEADMCFQKGLNDVSKRHHIRIWKQPGLWNGQELWMAAATRDVDYAYFRPGHPFSHRIDPNIDDERDKVAYDLAFTSCASPVGWVERAKVPRYSRNGTGDALVTDTRLAVVRFRECSPGRRAVNSDDLPEPVTRGGKWQRLLRREILIARNDLLRANPYWRIYEAGFRTLTYVRSHNRDALFETPTMSFSGLEGTPWRRALGLSLAALQ